MTDTNDTTPERHPGGRKTKLTPETADIIIRAVRAGNYLETSAALAGIHPATVYRWLERGEKGGTTNAPHREFRDMLMRARAEAEVRMVGTTIKAAQGGTLLERSTRRMPDGSELVTEKFAPPDGRVALEFLSRAFPDRWARRAALEVTGAGGGPIQVATAERLNALATRVQGAIAAASAAGIEDAELVDDEEADAA